MTRRSWIFRLSSLLLLPTAGLLAQAAAPAPATTPNLPTQRVLIHVHSDKPEDWNAAVKKANELMSSAAKPYDTRVEILATGDGLKLIDKNNALSSEVTQSIGKDVSFVACHASMRANKVADNQLTTGVGIVPSGGREIAARKAEGWTVLDDKSIK
ncbi:DsrE family protein [Terriglobus tenax]|uniref:DsrE family protein n=1 Tax=Terriglobus tenax TaxID=1111115 RepID=UPI0021E07EC1|nr:DsrE family protein [Terriglobus tenax]